MDWDAISAVGEIIGAIAVVFSLLYLAREIRQNTIQLERETKLDQLAALERNSETSSRIREMFIEDGDLAELFLKGSKDLSNLEGTDRFRFDQLLRVIFLGYQTSFIRQKVLESDPHQFQGANPQIDELLKVRGIAQWLESTYVDWRPEFRELVEARMKVVASENSEDE